ncbi:ABC transporter permease [Emticicia sp. SJ17W-69]|uniref:ABC transporter permease n=1 Tax=Emticicia sp. SJ17W-69 TaxID=3421657 RepID=UPI003EBC3EC9
MIRNYLKIAFRNLVKNKVYSFINIGGLAVGMSVAMLIGLWVYDELSFDKDNENYDRVAQVWQNVKFDVDVASYSSLPIPLAEELRSKYPDFEAVSLSSNNYAHILATKDEKFSKEGSFVEPYFAEMMSLKMLAGTREGLKELNSIMLSESLAKVFFGSESPINQVIKIDNKVSVKVTGVYADFPNNSTFKNVQFLSPWNLYGDIENNAKVTKDEWDANSYLIFAQLKKGVDINSASRKIKDIRMRRENPPAYKPAFFLHPMSKWHLYADFENGVNIGGTITYVWLFGIVGLFVLLLACINFMNLSTARSEKRAKEVGIRKAIGSIRGQLISQFLSESLLVVLLAFVFCLLFVHLFLPFFNEVSDKNMAILWSNSWFWLIGLGISILTGLVAGSYPALYLSSFQPVKVLKGTFRLGRFASIPRKALVVVQFTVSVTLIIGTIVVYRQIEFAKERPVGYNQNGLIEVKIDTPELYEHYEVLRNELFKTGAIAEISESSFPITQQGGGVTNVSWRGKSPEFRPLLAKNDVTYEFGKTVGWQIKQGRDFSKAFSSDSSAIILNEAALKLMGLQNPLDEFVKFGNKAYKIIGIVKDIVRESPFSPVTPSFFMLTKNNVSVINIKLNPQLSSSESLARMEVVFKKLNPSSPFIYSFVNKEYAQKFGLEERISKLATFFAILAIFISCLGLFGLASFVAEQRTKEIGIRKVLGATVSNLWALLSKDFVVLVLISLLIASPIAYYFMNSWIQNYTYRTDISWWIFVVAGFGALLITLLTVSFQAIKAALMNPVKSLKSE